MRTIKFISTIALLSSCLIGFGSCKEDEKPIDPPVNPTGLNVSDITQVSAVLTWSGEAADYELSINDADAVPVTGNTYTATGLTAATPYTWRVRAVEDGHYSDWVNGLVFTTEKPPVPVPASLAVSDVTHNSALFSWEGSATSYEIKIGEDITAVDEQTFTIDTLDPETEYGWSVRAIDGERASEWVDGPGFTTDIAPIVLDFTFYTTRYHLGDNTEANTSEFWVVLETFDPYAVGTAATGWQLALNFFTDYIEKGETSYDIPAGTYEFLHSTAANAINLDGMTRITQFIEGVRTDYPITSGTVIISGDHNEYTFEIKINLEDGRKIEGSFTDSFTIG